MFLGIQKIGKSRHKFKAKVTFLKVINQSTEKGVCFKVIIQRGSHQIQVISEPSRKGIAKFANEEYIIPMTLFCDEDSKQIKYLEKQAIIKIFECNEKGKEIRRIGKKDMDWSQYANKGKLKMEIQLDPQKKIDSPKLTIELFLERQDDDSKSVQTYSSNNDKKNDKDKDDRNLDEDFQTKMKQPNKIKDSKDKNGFSKDKKAQQKKSSDNNDEIQSKDSDDTFNKFKANLTYNIRKPQEDKRNINEDIDSITSPKSRPPVAKSMNVDKKNAYERQQEQSTQSPSRTRSPHMQFSEGQSPELQAFLLKQTLKKKQSQISTLKRQNEALKKTVDRLVQQAASTKTSDKKSNTDKQSEEIRKAIVSRDITIDQLSTTNKTLSARQQQYQKTIMKLRQELILSKQKIVDMKYRQAFLIQSFFQMGDKEALEEAGRFLSV